MNQRAELELRLAAVIEPILESGERKAESVRPNLDSRLRGNDKNPSLDAQSSTLTDSLDQALVKTVTATGSTRAKKVGIRYEPHEPSPHQVELVRLARRIAWETRERIMDSVRFWRAPFFPPPSIDMFAAPGELRLKKVDPREFVHQFTPGDPREAYNKSYGFFVRLREPFVTWEHAPASTQISKIKTQKTIAERMHGAVEKAREIEEETVQEAEASWGVPVLVPKLVPWRVVAGFLALAVLVTAPAGAVHLGRSVSASWAEVSSRGEAALADVGFAIGSDRAAQAEAWNSVSRELQASDKALNQANSLAVALSKALPQTRSFYSSARALLRSGDRAAQAAASLSRGMDRAFVEPARYPVDRLHLFTPYLEESMRLLDEAVESAGDVEADKLPGTARQKAQELVELLGAARGSVQEISLLHALAIEALGDEHQRRYLFVFQNPSELRPTGGFMGSLADIIVDRGEFRRITVPGGGPYDLRSQLAARVLPPEPMRLISTRWEFQDANWFPDFYASAEKINWFWSKAGQPTVDGIIAINADVMVKLLEITGPIEMPEYGKTITAENFLLETQKAVELEYDREENKPKKFIGDLMPMVLERLKDGGRDQWIAVGTVALESLRQKDIQIALFNEDEQALIERFGWGGRLKPTQGDALAVVEANIAGQKSDASIKEHVRIDTAIDDDGSIVNTVAITRAHEGEKGELFRGVNNVSYLRLYVPEGSELIEAEGFDTPSEALFKTPLEEDAPDEDLARIELTAETRDDVRITKEFGRTAFGGWVQLEPGETKTTVFTYRLPATAFDMAASLANDRGSVAQERAVYSMLLTSQSGKAGRTFEHHVQYPESWKSIWKNTESDTDYSGTWDSDKVRATVFSTHDGEETR